MHNFLLLLMFVRNHIFIPKKKHPNIKFKYFKGLRDAREEKQN